MVRLKARFNAVFVKLAVCGAVCSFEELILLLMVRFVVQKEKFAVCGAVFGFIMFRAVRCSYKEWTAHAHGYSSCMVAICGTGGRAHCTHHAADSEIGVSPILPCASLIHYRKWAYDRNVVFLLWQQKCYDQNIDLKAVLVSPLQRRLYLLRWHGANPCVRILSAKPLHFWKNFSPQTCPSLTSWNEPSFVTMSAEPIYIRWLVQQARNRSVGFVVAFVFWSLHGEFRCSNSLLRAQLATNSNYQIRSGWSLYIRKPPSRRRLELIEVPTEKPNKLLLVVRTRTFVKWRDAGHFRHAARLKSSFNFFITKNVVDQCCCVEDRS